MKRFAVLAWALALTWAWSGTAAAAEPDPVEILKKADEATKKVDAFTCEASFHGVGMTSAPKLSGKIIARRGDDGPMLCIKGESKQKKGGLLSAVFGKGGKAVEASFHVVTDGKRYVSIDHENETYTAGEGAGAAALLGDAARLYMREYFHPTPFQDEINGDEKVYERTEDVGGVECHVILVTYANGVGQTRWYFGVDDNLPRRCDRLVGQGNSVLTLTNLDVDPDIDDQAFNPVVPEGYEKKAYRAARERPALLAVGTKAPDFELETPDGKTVTLKGLRGQVVVMDFWATWCGPCKMAMPGVQKLHEKFKGKPVKVFGINCWEREDGDPAGYMKDKEFTYGLLLKADDVAKAYKVSGIPTFYIIGPDGKIVHASSGFDPSNEEEFAKVIEKALKTEL